MIWIDNVFLFTFIVNVRLLFIICIVQCILRVNQIYFYTLPIITIKKVYLRLVRRWIELVNIFFGILLVNISLVRFIKSDQTLCYKNTHHSGFWIIMRGTGATPDYSYHYTFTTAHKVMKYFTCILFL